MFYLAKRGKTKKVDRPLLLLSFLAALVLFFVAKSANADPDATTRGPGMEKQRIGVEIRFGHEKVFWCAKAGSNLLYCVDDWTKMPVAFQGLAFVVYRRGLEEYERYTNLGNQRGASRHQKADGE